MRGLFLLPVVGLLVACTHHHNAPVESALFAPPPVPMVQHTNRLWVELEGTPDKQCERTPTERPLCFARVRDAIGGSIERTLWPSFPGVLVKRKGDDLHPGDYVLHVRLHIDSQAADADGPGWGARGQGTWQLVRDGIPMAGESVASSSRGDFPYGRTLGTGAGEVIDAIVLHIAEVLGQLPETRPSHPVVLPAVAASRRTGPLFRALGPAACQPSDDAKRCSMASR